MARLFVMSDNLTIWIEINNIAPDGEGAEYRALCVGCDRDVVADECERFSFEDTAALVETHADSCKRCADATCRTGGRHDAGHRCRK